MYRSGHSALMLVEVIAFGHGHGQTQSLLITSRHYGSGLVDTLVTQANMRRVLA